MIAETPCLLLDRARLDANCARMREAVARRGVRLRPHVKTAKCVEVADAALGDAPFRGIAVSTLAEARFFAAAGWDDITYAVGVTPQKLPAAKGTTLIKPSTVNGVSVKKEEKKVLHHNSSGTNNTTSSVLTHSHIPLKKRRLMMFEEDSRNGMYKQH